MKIKTGLHSYVLKNKKAPFGAFCLTRHILLRGYGVEVGSNISVSQLSGNSIT